MADDARKPPPAPVLERGYVVRTPSTSSAGWWSETAAEPAPELIGLAGIDVLDRMRRTDAQCAAVLRAVNLPIERTTWRIDPNGARPEVVEDVSLDLGLPVVGGEDVPRRTKGRFSWSEHLRMTLLMLPFGHMFFEQVVRIENGKVRLRKLGARMPRTISAVNVAADGGLVSIEQISRDRGRIVIPVDRLVAYVHQREGGNWRGLSLLRPAYKHWIIKDRLLRVQAQTIERNGMGIPLYIGAPDEEDLDEGRELASAWRSGDSAGAAVPHDADLVLRGVEGDLPDAGAAIRYHDEQIGRAVLAHFLNLGQQTGSWALGTTFADFFTLGLQALAQHIADITTQHVVEDLVDWNYGPDEPAPKVIFDEIGSRRAITAEALKALADAGILLPDRVTEEAVRQLFGLPGKDSPSPVPA